MKRNGSSAPLWNVIHTVNWTVELAILLTDMCPDTGYDVGVRIDDRDFGELRGDVLTALVELPLEVLLGGTNTGVDSG